MTRPALLEGFLASTGPDLDPDYAQRLTTMVLRALGADAAS
jgi:hypothetical protein